MANILDYLGLERFLDKIKALFVTDVGVNGNSLTYTKDGVTSDITVPYATKTSSIPFGVTDDSSTSLAYTATVNGITELRDGVCCIIRNTKVDGGAGGITIDINGLGAKLLYRSNALSSTEHYSFPKNNTYLLVFSESLDGWIVGRLTDENDKSEAYNILPYTAHLKTKTRLGRYMICLTYNEEYVLPVNDTDNNSTTNKTLTTESFDPFGEVFFGYISYATLADNPAKGLYIARNLCNLMYSFNITDSTFTINKSVYLVMSPLSDGKCKLHSNPLSQTLPTTEDGLVYKLLGVAISGYLIRFYLHKPCYYFKDGQIREWTNNSDKQDLLVSGTNIKTVNNTSLLGSGNISIPKGDPGEDGEDAYQPFKGWFDSSSALSSAYPSPQVGDYAYVKGATSTDPVAIYACSVAGTWSNSGRTFNPANNQEFASGEALNTVHIVDGLDGLSATDVLSAKQGKVLDQKVAALGPKIGNSAKVTTYTTADAIGLVWNGSKWVTSNPYFTFIVPIEQNVEYQVTPAVAGSLFGVYTCTELPANDNTGGTTTKLSSSTAKHTFTNDEKYLVITGRPANDAYAFTSCTLTQGAYGIIKDVDELQDAVESLQTSMASVEGQMADVTDAKTTAHAVDDEVGDPTIEVTYTTDSALGLAWNGSKWVTTTGYKTIIIPITINRTYTVTPAVGGSIFGLYTCTEEPANNNTGGTTTSLSDKTSPHTFTGSEKYLVITGRGPNDTYAFTSAVLKTNSFGIQKDIEEMKEYANKDTAFPLASKKIVFFGDSLTQYSDSHNKGYTNYFRELSKATVVNGGIGGTQLRARGEQTLTPQNASEAFRALDIPNLVHSWATNDWSYVNAALPVAGNEIINTASVNNLKNNAISTADIVVIAGGTNDLNDSDFGIHKNGNVLTVCGGIDYIVSSLLSVNPNLCIIFFSPMPRKCTYLDGYSNQELAGTTVWCDEYRTSEGDGSKSFPNLVKTIIDCVVRNHVPCGNLYNDIGITEHNIEAYANDKSTTDYTHLYTAFPRMARFMYHFILSNQNWDE